MNQIEKKLEYLHLSRVLEQIQLQFAVQTNHYKKSQAELEESLLGYWENQGSDFFEEAQLIETVSRQKSLTASSQQRRLQFKRLEASPYFGRIDFQEEDLKTAVSQPIYIGISTLSDQATGEFLIYDWRTPVAGMFYDFERGNAYYQCPAGTIKGVITLKRQYKIVDSKLIYMFDSDLKIDDEMLQEILGQSVDDKMRTIVTSIQREQNRVIRDEKHRLLLVQGPAGSGKTSIALHRAAYLLYRERQIITSKNILIFSPNHLFNDYISSVLPELGEENILQTTFWDYIESSIRQFSMKFEDWNTLLAYLLTNQEDAHYQIRTASITFKTSPVFTGLINHYLQELENFWVHDFPAIQFRNRTLLTPAEWKTLFLKDLAYLPIAERLLHIRRMVRVKLRPILQELRKEHEERIAAAGEEVNENTIKALARIEAHQDLEVFLKELDWLTELNPFQLYRRLFEDPALFQRLIEKTSPPVEWNAIRDYTMACFGCGCIPYEDIFPLLFLQGKLAGFPVKNEIRHLIIDEAQDFTELQFQILRNIFPKCTWTILGDPEQSIHPFFQVPSFERTTELMEIADPIIIQLTRGYRSTREIQMFARAILAETKPVEFIQRSGTRPKLLRFPDAVSSSILLIPEIQQLKNEGFRSIAVICKTAAECASIFDQVKDKLAIHLVTIENTEFHTGIMIIPVYLAKGLEFDAVIVYNVSHETYSREYERNILYVACTRALHRLILIYHGTISPFLKSIPAEFYHTEER